MTLELKRRLKSLASFAARRTGVNACCRRQLRKRLLVLCYHSIIHDELEIDEYRRRDATRRSEFGAQLDIIKKYFKPISASDLIEHLREMKSLPEYPVLITFDDGYRNNLEHALPELMVRNVPAIVHVTTGHIGAERLLWVHELDERVISWPYRQIPVPNSEAEMLLPNCPLERMRIADRFRSQCKRLPLEKRDRFLDRLRIVKLALDERISNSLYAFLTWDEVRELDSHGIAIGAHTIDHPILTSIDNTELRRQLSVSKHTVEAELAKDCPCLAYTNGGRADFSPEVVAMAREVGFKCAFVVVGRPNHPELQSFEIDRVPIPGKLSSDEFTSRLHGWRTYLDTFGG